MDELVLKVRADAKGVRQEMRGIADETDNFKVSTVKASTAVRGFVNDLAQAKDGADVASAALGAFAKILGTSLAGTAVVIAGKTLIDSFLKVSEAVKGAKDAVAQATLEVQKLGAIRSFEEGAKQAGLLYAATEKVNAEIKKIEASKLQNFIAGIRGAKDEMVALAIATKAQADEAARAGIVQGAMELERAKNLTETDKAVIKSNESYNKLIDAANKLGDVELRNRLIIEQQRTASAIIAESQNAKEAQAQDEWYKRADAAWSAEAKATEAQTALNQKQAEERSKSFQAFLDAETKAAADREKEHQKEMERAAQRIKSIDEEIKVLEQKNQVIKAGMAEDILLTSLSRGPGQAPTSEETGYLQKSQREVENERKAIADAELDSEIKRLKEEATKKKKEEGAFYKGIDPEQIGKREARKSLAERAIADKKAKDPLIANAQAIEDNTKKIEEAIKQREEENKKISDSTEGFFKLSEPVNLLETAFPSLASSAESTSSDISDLESGVRGLSYDFSTLGGGVDGLLTEFQDLSFSIGDASKALKDFFKGGEIEILNTKSIILQR